MPPTSPKARRSDTPSCRDHAPGTRSLIRSATTELIADRVWRTKAQLELAVVEYLGWFNASRLHSALGYRTPAEVEADWVKASRLRPPQAPVYDES